MILCTVYNASYEPLDTKTPADALVLIFKGKAVVIEEAEDHTIRTATQEFKAPKSVRLNYYVKTNRHKHKTAVLNKHNLYLRDDYTCQYCGRHVSDFKKGEYLTKDHIVPKERGGENTWENLVTACSPCNNRKDNKTPKEARMKLLSKPVAPSAKEIRYRKQAKVVTLEI